MSLIHDFQNHHIKVIEVDYIVAERLQEARKSRGITITEMANKTGYNIQQLANYERRIVDIPTSILFWYMKECYLPKKFFYYEKWQRI